MPATAARAEVDPHDPLANLDGGAFICGRNTSGSRSLRRLALAAYNAGPEGREVQHDGVPPFDETGLRQGDPRRLTAADDPVGKTGAGVTADPRPPHRRRGEPVASSGPPGPRPPRRIQSARMSDCTPSPKTLAHMLLHLGRRGVERQTPGLVEDGDASRVG
ncbi:MAG: lytic transglycosylase domain-containing protein [Paracoccaceae bacterium]